MADAAQVPLAVFAARAIEREYMYEDAFQADLALPIEFQNLPDDNSINLLRFIVQHPKTGLENLLRCKNMYAVATDAEVKSALAYLLSTEQVEWVLPDRSQYKHPPEYRVIRPTEKTKNIAMKIPRKEPKTTEV